MPPAGTPDCVTSFVFRVRNIPAALYKALGGFATNGVNMTKLESYMLTASSPPRSSSPMSTAIPRRAGEAGDGGAGVLLAGSPGTGTYPAHRYRLEHEGR